MKICLLIPTYNEEHSIGPIIEKLKHFPIHTIVVVDDGSSDRTADIAREKGAIVMQNRRNQGKGSSLRQGFKYALAGGFDLVITMDGDGQHNPDEIPRFLDFLKTSQADIILGNRMQTPQGMPFLRWVTNKLMSSFISFLLREKIPDTQCGLRLIRRKVLEKITMSSSKYEIESELLVKAVRRGFSIESIPIKTIYREGIISQINPVVDTIRFFRFIFKNLFFDINRVS